MKYYSLMVLSIGSMLLFSCQSASKNDTVAVVKKDSLTVPAAAYKPDTNNEETVNLVRLKLTAMLKEDLSKNIVSEASRKFILFEYDLNDDGKKEIFVGLTGPYFCGSGGCTFLLLDHEGKQVTRFTVTDYPVVIAATKTKGWKDLILSSAGKNHLMKFNGTAYPSNPSIQPVFDGHPGDELPRLLDFTNETYPWFKY